MLLAQLTFSPFSLVKPNLAACRVTAPPSAPAAAGMFQWRRLAWRTLMWSYMV